MQQTVLAFTEFPKSIRQRFEEFHADNPQVYRELVRRCRLLKSCGIDDYSIAGVYEVVRYDRLTGTRSKDGFKLNNDHRAYYARRIMDNEPDLADFFEIRSVGS